MRWLQEKRSSRTPPILIDRGRDGFAQHFNWLKTLGLLGNAGLGAVEADGGGGISRGLGVGDFAGDHDAALNGFSQHSLARFRMLVPAERFARQKGIAEPLEGDEG